MSSDLTLPEPLPADPLPLFQEWFREAAARRTQPNPDAMVVATVASNGEPSARVVLCKRIGRCRLRRVLHELPIAQGARARGTAARRSRVPLGCIASAGPHRRPDRALARRRERRVLREPRARQPDRRVGQRAERAARIARDCCSNACASCATRLGIAPGATSGTVPRPPHWGGYRLWIERIELWTEGANRVHDRAVWTRHAAARGRAFVRRRTLAQHAPESLSARRYLITFSVGLVRLPSSVVVGAGSVGGAGGCGGVSASEKIIPCPVSRA